MHKTSHKFNQAYFFQIKFLTSEPTSEDLCIGVINQSLEAIKPEKKEEFWRKIYSPFQEQVTSFKTSYKISKLFYIFVHPITRVTRMNHRVKNYPQQNYVFIFQQINRS